MTLLNRITHGLQAINPINLGEKLVLKILINTGLSVLKGLVATLIVALTVASQTPPASPDAHLAAVWGLCIVGIHALITALQHFLDNLKTK